MSLSHARRRFDLGFTLVELIVVMLILVTAFTMFLVYVDPSRSMGLANDTKRSYDLLALADALANVISDTRGAYMATLPSSPTEFSSDSPVMIALCTDLVPTYVGSLPSDPFLDTTERFSGDCHSFRTGYTVWKSVNNRVVVQAPLTQMQTTIQILR